MPGLISTLNIARKGIYASQDSINTTSHNISNANTEGYSRQRVNLQASRPFDTPSLNSAVGPGQIGTGVEVSSIDRIRNLFLDYQIRTETSTKGEYDERSQFLGTIEAMFNTTSTTGIDNLMSNFFSSWSEVSLHPESSNSRTVAVQQTLALTDELNHTYGQLQKLKDDVQGTIKQSVLDTNSLLTQIDKVNQEIIQIKVAGQNPNDLQDRRDLLIDQLSKNLNINVDRNPRFDGQDIAPVDVNGVVDPVLVKSVFNDQVKRFSYISDIAKGDVVVPATTPPSYTYKVTYYKYGDMTSSKNAMNFTVNMSDSEFKNLDQCRILWASADGIALKDGGIPISKNETLNSFKDVTMFQPTSGELSGDISIQKEIDDYSDQLTKIAKAIAFTVNAVHSGSSDGTTDKVPYFVNSDTATYTNDNLDLTKYNVVAAEQSLTAGNITVNKELISDVMKIKTKTNDDKFSTTGENTTDGSSDGKRALEISQLKDSILMVQNIDNNTKRSDLVTSLVDKGSGVKTVVNSSGGTAIDGFYKDTINKLAVQQQEAKRIVKNQDSVLAQFQNSRDSISGVSIDEEMTNLLQYQHSYQANAKVISTVDQLLDVLIGLVR